MVHRPEKKVKAGTEAPAKKEEVQQPDPSAKDIPQKSKETAPKAPDVPLLRVACKAKYLEHLFRSCKPAPVSVYLKRGQIVLRYLSPKAAAEAVSAGLVLLGVPLQPRGIPHKKAYVSLQGAKAWEVLTGALTKALAPHGVAKVFLDRGNALIARPASAKQAEVLVDRKEA
eukprot:RCo013181